MNKRIMLTDGRVVEIPEECKTIEDIHTWLRKNYGKNSDMLISAMEIYFPEIKKHVRFLEDEAGMLVSTTSLTEEELQKIQETHPAILPCRVIEQKKKD